MPTEKTESVTRAGLVKIKEGTGQGVIYIDPHSPRSHLLSSSPGVLKLLGDVASVILGADQGILPPLMDCLNLCKKMHDEWKREEEARGDIGEKSEDGLIQYFN